MNRIRPKLARLGHVTYANLRQQVLRRDAGGANCVARCRTWKSITNSFAATPATTPIRT